MRWRDAHDLVHYTQSADVVCAILQNGFMLVPNRRQLVNRLLGTRRLFQTREPQQFGMVSFTELPRDQTLRHREQFGDFGIVVRWEWALQHDAQRVLYVGDEGSVMNSLSWLFRRAHQELEKEVPEKVTEMHLTNKAIAGMYSQMYHHLLTLYEFMEPDRNSSQVEWRIVNRIPYYHRSIADRDGMMAELRKHASYGFGTLKVRPVDVEALLCPPDCVAELRKAIPRGFLEVPIRPLARPGSLVGLWNMCVAGLRTLTRRRPRVILQAPPTKGAPAITERSAGMFTLPAMKELNGIVANPDEVLERAHCEMQYKSEVGDRLELRMPFTQSIRLLCYLTHMVREPKMRELVTLAVRHEEAEMAKERAKTERAAAARRAGNEPGASGSVAETDPEAH